MENKEKTKAEKFFDIVSNFFENKTEEKSTNKSEEKKEEVKHSAVQIAVGASVPLLDGKYSAQDGTQFTIASGAITEVTPPVKDNAETVKQSAETKDKPNDELKDLVAKFELMNKEIVALKEEKVKMEVQIKTLGSEPGGKTIKKTDSVADSKDDEKYSKMKKYFTTDSEYKTYVQMMKVKETTK